MSVAIVAGFEGTHGTETSTYKGIPCAFKSKLLAKHWVPQEARMGQDTSFSIIPGLQWEEWEVAESAAYHDTFGIFLGSAMGTPTKTVVDTIFDNKFLLADDPESLSIEFDQPHRSTQPYQTLYNVVDELTIGFDINGNLTYSASGVGMPRSTTSAPSYSFSTARPFAPWQGAVTLNGTGSYAKLLKGSVKIKRNRKPFHTISNATAPTTMTIGDRVVTLDLLIDFSAVTEFDAWKAATVGDLNIVFVDAGVTIGTTSNPTLTIDVARLGYQEAEVDTGGELPSLKLTGTALYDVTDATALTVTLRSSQDYTAL